MRVFILGGTQFMGRLTVEALLDAGHQVVLFNRGRTSNPFESRQNVKVVRCDRIGDREGFRDAFRSQGTCDAVVDFIGFQEAFVEDALEALTLPSSSAAGQPKQRKKCFATKHYIFVSTDCVYWALRVPLAQSESRLTEQDAVDLPSQEFDKHVEYCESTMLGEYQLRYGGNKLSCERVLEEAWRESEFPYTVLRLPDVYGPFDNLGGFWDIVSAVEMERPIPAALGPGRVRGVDGSGPVLESGSVRFSWAFAPDVRDAILACLHQGSTVHGLAMHIAHEEAVSLQETAALVAEAMGKSPKAACFDNTRPATVPSTDFGALDVTRALQLLRPWRPTPIRAAVGRAVKWFFSSNENRQYHRHVYRDVRTYNEDAARRVACEVRDVPRCWAGAPEKAGLMADGPVVLVDAFPDFTNISVLGFMQRLMDQVGDTKVTCQLQRDAGTSPGREAEEQTWPLRHFAGHLISQSEHSASYQLENAGVIAHTDLAAELRSPLAGLRADAPGRILRLGGVGARQSLRRTTPTGTGGRWDCALLGRRKWRFFPPETLPSLLGCSVPGCAGVPFTSSPVDSFVCGPDSVAVHRLHSGFDPRVCWECEQTMGDAVVVPDGWWYQTYDDDRTLSVSAAFGAELSGAAVVGPPPPLWPALAPGVDEAAERRGGGSADSSKEVMEFELVD